MLCTKAAGAAMKRQGAGRIVNISSVAGFTPTGSSIAYAVSKAGLNHLTRCMAVGLGPEVLVNCVAPGYIDGTRATENLTPEYRERSKAASVLQIAADKDDIARQVVDISTKFKSIRTSIRTTRSFRYLGKMRCSTTLTDSGLTRVEADLGIVNATDGTSVEMPDYFKLAAADLVIKQ